MTTEFEQAKRVIIESDSVQCSFNFGRDHSLENVVLHGKTTDGVLAIFLADGDEKLAREKLRDLKRDNPNVNFEPCRGLSLVAPGGNDLVQMSSTIIVGLLEQMIGERKIKVGWNSLALKGVLPAANVNWRGIWARTDQSLQEIKTGALKNK